MSIRIDDSVIAKVAGSAAIECFGIVGMSTNSIQEGIIKLLKKENLKQGVNVYVKDNIIDIDLHVIIASGVNISTVADNLMSTVKYNVEDFTGMKVGKIKIFVEGVKAID